MANIKFSDFTAEAEINNFEGIVGYNTTGNLNLRIAPLEMPARYDGNIALGDSTTLQGTNLALAGEQNLAIGFNALGSVDIAGAGVGGCIAIGDNSLTLLTTFGAQGTGEQLAIGVGAQAENGGYITGFNITPADENFAIGYNALAANKGDWSAAIPTPYPDDLGNFNTAVGGRSLEDLDGGTSNTALGHNSGFTLFDGSANTLVGFEAGSNTAQSINLLSEDGITAMGWQAASQGDYSITIGYNAASISYVQSAGPTTVPPARTIVIGSDSVSAAPNNIIIGSDSSITLGGVYTSSEDVLIGHDCEIRTPAIATFAATNNTSVGNRSTIEGSYNTHMGYFVDIFGDDNTSIGYFNTIYGNNNCTLGDFSVVGTGSGPGQEASHCIAVGGNTTTTAGSIGSMVIGVNTTNTLTVGAFEIGFGGTDVLPASNDVIFVGAGGGGLGESKLDLAAEFNISAQYTQFEGQVAVDFVDEGVLTPAPTYTIDWENANVQKLTLGSSGTNINATNIKPGTYYFIIQQASLGAPYTLGTWSPDFKWPGGTPPVLSTGNSEVDIITFISDGISLYGTIENNFS